MNNGVGFLTLFGWLFTAGVTNWYGIDLVENGFWENLITYIISVFTWPYILGVLLYQFLNASC